MGVNDTPEDVEGLLEFRAFSKFDNAVRESFSMPVRLAAGESGIFTTLDFLWCNPQDCVLFCELKGADGKVIARNVEHFDMERDTLFPEAKLSLRLEGGELRWRRTIMRTVSSLRGCTGGRLWLGFFR